MTLLFLDLGGYIGFFVCGDVIVVDVNLSDKQKDLFWRELQFHAEMESLSRTVKAS